MGFIDSLFLNVRLWSRDNHTINVGTVNILGRILVHWLQMTRTIQTIEKSVKWSLGPLGESDGSCRHAVKSNKKHEPNETICLNFNSHPSLLWYMSQLNSRKQILCCFTLSAVEQIIWTLNMFKRAYYWSWRYWCYSLVIKREFLEDEDLIWTTL